MANDDSPLSGDAPEESQDAVTDTAAPEASTHQTESITGEDETLTCVQCGSQFVFSAEEQAFFKKRDLHVPPKRCKACRVERRKARRGVYRGRMKDYRSPSFRERRRANKIYRSPAFQGKQNVDGVYRSPAFQDRKDEGEDVYRSPGFQDQEASDDIYRAPGFQSPPVEEDEPTAETTDEGEHDLEQGPPPGFQEPKSAAEIYRSPAFGDTDPANYAPSYRRRQMHDIVCAECGKKSKVPFKPRKDRPVYCKECYATKR